MNIRAFVSGDRSSLPFLFFDSRESAKYTTINAVEAPLTD